MVSEYKSDEGQNTTKVHISMNSHLLSWYGRNILQRVAAGIEPEGRPFWYTSRRCSCIRNRKKHEFTTIPFKTKEITPFKEKNPA